MKNTRHKIKRFFQGIFLGIRLMNGLYLILFIGLLSIFVLPLLFSLESPLPSFKDTGPIGDTINGIAGPFIALTAAVLTYFAFYMQYRANRLQLKQFREQKRQFEAQLKDQTNQFNTELGDRKRAEEFQRFENKYYELLRFHRANMEEMEIGGTLYGRKCFVRMYDEFRICYYICVFFHSRLDDTTQRGVTDVTAFAYKLFFFGIGTISEKNYKLNTEERRLFQDVKEKLIEIQQDYQIREIVPGTDYRHVMYKLGNEPLTFEAYYYPFDGHISRLAHYYRHLFHTVKFVVNQKEDLISYTTKLEYLQTLRAQLSNHEQVMLYYNAIAGPGKAWFDNKYLTTYKMIHNLPFNIADFGKEPHDHPLIKEGIEEWNKKGGKLFEQDER